MVRICYRKNRRPKKGVGYEPLGKVLRPLFGLGDVGGELCLYLPERQPNTVRPRLQVSMGHMDFQDTHNQGEYHISYKNHT